MANTTPVGYNPSKNPISGTTQVGDLAVGTSPQEYSIKPGGITYWMGPNQDLGYVVAKPVPSGNQPFNPSIGETAAYVGFSRSTSLTQASFVDLTNSIAAGATSFTSTQGAEAKSWLNSNGYWTSYVPGPNSTSLILDWNVQNSTSYSGSGSSITDLQGNSNGTLVGTIDYTSGSPSYLNVQGGSTEYIRTNTNLNSKLSPANSGTSISVFVWVYPTSNGVIISEQGTTTPDGGWYDSQIELVSGTMKFRVWNLSFPYLSSSISTPLNNWYYVGFTYSGTTLTAYVNGQSAGTSSLSRETPGNNGYGLYYNLGYPTGTNMGGGGGSTFRFGALHVYNTGISSSTVLSNYNATKGSYGL